IGSIDNEFAPRPRQDGTRVLIYTLVDGHCLVGPDATPPHHGRDTESPSTYPADAEPTSPTGRPRDDGAKNGRTPPRDRPTVKRGSTGQAVQRLQKRLARLGHDPGPVDGNFGARTDAAVRSFQKANSLDVDGVVGPDTW